MAEQHQQTETLERGNIYFFYRPKVEEDDPEGLEDVQRFYMVLHPEGGHMRLTIIGRKRLPDPSHGGKARNWGFVDKVHSSSDSIRDELSGETYQTKTRGERHTPPARPVGEGVYRLVRQSGHTHLAYSLELPKETGEAQEETQIEAQASYVISVKNPERGSPQAAGLAEQQKVDYPQYLQEKFRGRKFADADPPAFLDKEGTEFLLIAASKDVEEELGLELEPQDESVHTADIFQELHLDKSKRSVKPLFEGKWD